jgi:hypothetical protein
MAVLSHIFVPAQGSGGIESVIKVAALAGQASSAEIALGNNQLFMVTAFFVGAAPTGAANINLAFGPTGMAAAAATDIGLSATGFAGGSPSLTYTVWDTGDSFKSIRFWNNAQAAATVDIYVTRLSRV